MFFIFKMYGFASWMRQFFFSSSLSSLLKWNLNVIKISHVQFLFQSSGNDCHNKARPNCRHPDLEALRLWFFSKTYTSFQILWQFKSFYIQSSRDMLMNKIPKCMKFIRKYYSQLNKNTLKLLLPRMLGCVHFSQFWIDYEGMKVEKGRFVDSSLSIWFVNQQDMQSHKKSHSVNG